LFEERECPEVWDEANRRLQAMIAAGAPLDPDTTWSTEGPGATLIENYGGWMVNGTFVDGGREEVNRLTQEAEATGTSINAQFHSPRFLRLLKAGSPRVGYGVGAIDNAFMALPDDARKLIKHPVAPFVKWGMECLPVPDQVEWNARQHLNVPGLMANTRYVVMRRSEHGQGELHFDERDLMAPPPPDKPRFETAYLPADWAQPPPSTLVQCAMLDLFYTGTDHGCVPSPTRMGWELLLAPKPGDYIGRTADLRIKLKLLHPLLSPLTKYVSTRHGPQMREDARWLNDPDHAERWSANDRDPPLNLVLFYDAPAPPYEPDMEVGAYVTLPDGGLRQGAQIDNHLRRILAASSIRQHRVYVAACCYWDRYATVNGILVPLTVPEADPEYVNPGGYLVGVNGKLLYRRGAPTKDPRHKKAVVTGRRLRNPAIDNAYPWMEGDDSILMAHRRVAPTKKRRNLQRKRTVETLLTLRQQGTRKADRKNRVERDMALDFEIRYRSDGVLTGEELEALPKAERPSHIELEAVRPLPSLAHFAAHQERRKRRR